MSCCVLPMHPVPNLSLNVHHQSACTKPEKRRVSPFISKLLLHKSKPRQCVLGRTNTTGRLETNIPASFLIVVPYRAHHDKSHFKGCIDALLSSAGLNEIRSCHHGNQACPVDIGHSAAFTYCKDGLHVNASTSLFASLHVIIQGLPISSKHCPSRNHNINFCRAPIDGCANLFQALSEW